jgi:hypothetical protein
MCKLVRWELYYWGLLQAPEMMYGNISWKKFATFSEENFLYIGK